MATRCESCRHRKCSGISVGRSGRRGRARRFKRRERDSGRWMRKRFSHWCRKRAPCETMRSGDSAAFLGAYDGIMTQIVTEPRAFAKYARSGRRLGVLKVRGTGRANRGEEVELFRRGCSSVA